ncbi:MAG: Fe-S cluster assembly protein SufD [Rhodospirillaceae bacterium]
MKPSALLDHPFGDRYAAALPGPDSARRAARARLLAEGLPGPKREEWRFTPLRALAKIPFLPAPADIDVSAELAHVTPVPGALRLVLVNGRYRPDLSDRIAEPGLSVSEAASPDLEIDLPLAVLNAAYMSGGVSINARGVVARPVHLISIGGAGREPAAFHPRLSVSVAPAAKLTIFESHRGLPGEIYLANPVTTISVGTAGVLRRYVLVQEDSQAYHLATTIADVAANARLDAFHLGVGGGTVRQEINVDFVGEGAKVRLNGAYALAGSSHHDFTTFMNHDVPHCTSSQVFKGVVDGQSHGVYQGRVLVARHAQKTDGQQLHKALFLSRGPQIDCKPELEIYADDVKCGHGATTGELDPDQLFYLAARGIDPEAARRLLVQAFLADALENVEDASAHEMLAAEISGWLARRAA